MIVIARKYGQLCNRLCLSAHVIAAAREYGTTLINPALGEYAKYFCSTADDSLCRYPPKAPRKFESENSRPGRFVEFNRELGYQSVYLTARICSHLHLNRFPFRNIRLAGDDQLDLGSKEFRSEVGSSRIVCLSGWCFRSNELLFKHMDTIRRYFEIIPEHRHRVDDLAASLRSQSDCVIGVHIRHGDYANWQGGRYYYPISEYADIMRHAQQQLGDRHVTFLVCGNAELSPSDFAGLNVRFGTGHLIEDLYTFAKTDFLIGPPSTYTKWASIYGDVPRDVIEKKGQMPELTQLGTGTSKAA